MTIALYMDHHIPAAVTKGLRRRGVDWLSDDRTFAGLVFGVPMRLTIGQAVADLELMAKALDPDDMQNRIEFVPL